jgi:phosphate-selective porin
MKNILSILISALIFLPGLSFSQGCIETTSEDGGVSIVGYIQPQFDYNFLGNDFAGKSLDESNFYFRRARIGAVGNIPYDISYYAMFEFSPHLGGAQILDAFVSYNRFAPYAKFSIGQFKSPFGLELSTPCHRLHTIERSMVVETLAAPFRDLGVMLSGGTGELSFWGSETENFLSYNVAILNGTGMNIEDNNTKKDFVGRVVVHPFEFIKVGTSYRFGKYPTQVDDAPDDERSRIGVDVSLDYKNFLVQGEYISGSDVGSYTTGGGCGDPLELHQGSVDREGFMVLALYRTPWNIEPVIKYESFDPNLAVDAIEDPNQYIQNTLTFGINYFFNEHARMQINYLYQAEETGEVERMNDAFMVQLQADF